MNLTKLPNTDAVEGFCLVKSAEKKTTAKGGVYLDLVLGDSSGEISAKLWDYNENRQGVYNQSDLVKIRGNISVYNGNDQLRIDRIRIATENDEVCIDDFVPTAEYSGLDMYNELLLIASRFQDEELKLITLEVLSENREKLLYWPAAFKLHHAIRGGLLYHTLSVVRLAEAVCNIYPFVDKDLLITGAILHDMAKIEEFEVAKTGLVTGYSPEGNLIGHLAKGAINLEKKAEKLGTSKDTLMLLQHMVLSHHGEPEFGAAVPPMFIEAELLSELDLMDARIYEMARAIEETEQGSFSKRIWSLDNRKLYRHGRNNTDAKAKLDINNKESKI